MPEPSAEERQAARNLLEELPPEALAELQQAFLDSANASHCENDPEINELLVGRCYDCGQLWCTECDKLLKPGATVCACWNDEVPKDTPGNDE